MVRNKSVKDCFNYAVWSCYSCRCCFVVAALFTGVFRVFSQETIYLGVDNGLSQGFVTAIEQDRSGYIWIGTLNGLNRYNGYDFKIYKSSRDRQNGLFSSAIKSLDTDENGRLWIYCQGVLQYYDEATDGFVTPPDINREINTRKETIRLFGKNRLLLLNEDTLCDIRLKSGSSAVSAELVRRVRFPSDEMGIPYCAFRLGSTLWIGTSAGVCVWNGMEFRRYYPEIRRPVQDIWADSVQNILYLKTATELLGYQNNRPVCCFSFEGKSYAIRVRRDYSQNWQPVVWGEAIWALNGIGIGKTPMVFEKDITAVLRDRQGNIWVGLDASGLVCYLNRKKKIRTVLNSGYSAAKPPVSDGAGGVWLNLKNGRVASPPGTLGVYYWSDLTGTAKRAQPAIFSSYYADSDKQGSIWSVDKSLNLKELKSGRYYTGLGGIDRLNQDYGITCLEDGSLLLISEDAHRIVFCNPSNGTSITVPDLRPFFSTNWWDISSLCKSTSISPWIWLTGPGGIVGLRPDWSAGKCEIRSFDKNLLSDELVSNPRFIFAKTDAFDGDKVWIGGWDGLFCWNTVTDSLKVAVSTDPVFCMAQTEQDILWLGTQHGLVRYNLQNSGSKTFTQADGLPASEFNRNTAAVMPDGMIVMGTVNGTICFYPGEMIVHEKPAFMVISDVRQGSKNLYLFRSNDGYQTGNLPYGSDNVMVQFSLLDFTNVKTAQYRFRFSGGSNQWVSNGLNNTVTLTGLTSGSHMLEVQGSLDGIEWSESQFLSFEVDNPWWTSWWAILLLLLLTLAPAFLIVRNRRLLLREKHRNELLRLESEHEAALMSTKERILTNVAHDLRTPLTLITGLAEKIGGDSDEKIVKAAETIRRQSQELLDMIGQILNLGRIRELGGIPLSPKPLNLDLFLHTLTALTSSHAQQKSVSLTRRIAQNIPQVCLDENGLRSILGNLLSNAIKFTPGGGRIMLEAFAEDENLVILVRDSGPGIPPEKVRFLFQRYYQVDGEKFPGGTGIGLAYAAEVTKLMGGQLSWVPPVLGTVTGTMFMLSFPLGKIGVQPSESVSQLPDIQERQDKNIRNGDQRPLVLVVEDQREMAEYIRSILEEEYEVEVSQDGNSGLETAIELIPDLIISDVIMPGLSGTDMCRALRDDIRTSHIPVIMLSGKTENSAVRAGLSSGATLYMAKPFDHEILKKYVANSLQLSAQTRQFFESSWSGNKSVNSDGTLPDGISTEKEDTFIREVMDIIAANYSDESFTVDKLAYSLHISLSQLRRKIIALGGESAGAMLRNYRLEQAKQMLLDIPRATIAEVAFACGFSDSNYFSSLFGKEFGMTPRKYRFSIQEDKHDSNRE